jgi:hypothetical protein
MSEPLCCAKPTEDGRSPHGGKVYVWKYWVRDCDDDRPEQVDEAICLCHAIRWLKDTGNVLRQYATMGIDEAVHAERLLRIWNERAERIEGLQRELSRLEQPPIKAFGRELVGP